MNRTHTCMKLNFTDDSLHQAQTNGVPSQEKISSWKKRTYFVVNSAGQSIQYRPFSLLSPNREWKACHDSHNKISCICCSVFACYQFAILISWPNDLFLFRDISLLVISGNHYKSVRGYIIQFKGDLILLISTGICNLIEILHGYSEIKYRSLSC